MVAGNTFARGRDVEQLAVRAKPHLTVVGEISDQAKRVGLVDGDQLLIIGDENIHGAHQTPLTIARGRALSTGLPWGIRHSIIRGFGKFAAKSW